MDRVLVVIPTYNEADNIGSLIPEVLAMDGRIDVLVVDDASSDGTREIVEKIIPESDGRVNLLGRPGKLGLGSAYKDGFALGIQEGYEVFVEMDADWSHSPEALPDLISAIDKGADLALGSRYIGGRLNVVNWPITRLILSYGANIYARFWTGLKVSDATGGFRAYHRELLEVIDLEAVHSEGYSFQVEMAVRAESRGARIVEVPIVFTDRTSGESKMSNKVIREAVWRVVYLGVMHRLGKL